MTLVPSPESARVVAGVDGSDSARHAAAWAAHEAEARDVPLLLLHAFGAETDVASALGPIEHEGGRKAEGRALLEATAALIGELYPALAVETELCPLAPVERLVELSGRGALIVTGTRGRGGLAGALLGSVSRALAAYARGPLVVVRGARAREYEGPVVLDVGHDPSDAAIEYALAAAQRCGASVHAVRTEAPPFADIEMPVLMPAGLGVRGTRPPGARSVRVEQDRAIEREVAEVSAAVAAACGRYPGVQVGISVARGDEAEILAAEGEHARLVVLGRPRRKSRGPLPARPGHVVGELLSHCPVPVAVIPAPDS